MEVSGIAIIMELKMTNQEVFDKGMKGVLAQQAFSWNEDEGECSYFDKNKNRCMLGHLGTEEQAKKWEEDKELTENISKEIGIDSEFAAELQAEHDDIVMCLNVRFSEEDFIFNMKIFAEKNGLNFDY